MMKMYKEQGATPILGCLPMLLQMPIWIALWTGLNAAVELRHAGLLPFWITDLAAPDALFSFGTPLPLIGATFNLLPILLTVAMFFQAKMNPATAGAAASPEQQTQQKMMRYMMPGMMLMIFYNAPSGLSLYVMTSISAGVIEQILIRKHIAEKEAAEAARTTTVRVGGKGFRDNREKKPKSPYKKPW
jgi:YidC/Oxa1 family membrane protein insertase